MNYFTMIVRLDDGREYALNVWTFDFAAEVRETLDEAVPVKLKYCLAPDLLVQGIARAEVTLVVE